MFNIGCWKIKRLKRDFWHSCRRQRPQNKLLWSMKGIESLRIQSFKGFWKSRKIPGLDFWESRDRDFEKIPGSRDIPGSRRGLVMRSWDGENSHHGELVTSRSRSSPSPESFSSNSQLFPASLFTPFLIFQPSVQNTSVDIQAHHWGHPLWHRAGGQVPSF